MRVANSLRNILVAFIGQGTGIIVSFISRLFFINILGTEYLGIDGLFTNILSMLSLAEMGLGTAIVYSLYKPLANNNRTQIKALVDFYGKSYKIIGGVIAFLGLSLLPFLNYFIKDRPEIINIYGIYLLFLANAVSSYFFAYKRTLIIADQKSYITTFYRYSFYIMLNVFQILILLITRNYVLFLLMQIIFTLLENIQVSKAANRMYPYLKSKSKVSLTNLEKMEIIKNVRALFYHKVGGVVVGGTDNIIISSCVGLTWVGLYSNYYLIINAINIIIGQIFGALTASVGNLNALQDQKKSFIVFKRILLMNFWIATIFTIGLSEVLNLFISLWIGEQYTLNKIAVFILVTNFYITLSRKTVMIFKDSLGLFWKDRFKPLVEALINIIVSLILASKLGIVGVFLGTLISTISTSLWVEPYILYKYGFQLNVRLYFEDFIKYTCVMCICWLMTHYLNNYFFGNEISWFNLLLKGCMCIFTTNIILTLFFNKTSEFKYFKSLISISKLKLLLWK